MFTILPLLAGSVLAGPHRKPPAKIAFLSTLAAANRSLGSIGSMKQMWVRSARRAVRKEGLGNGPLGHLVGLEKGLGVIVYLTQPVWPHRIPYEVAMMKFCVWGAMVVWLKRAAL